VRAVPRAGIDRGAVLLSVAATGMAFARVFPFAELLVVVGVATLVPAAMLLGAAKAPGRFLPRLLRVAVGVVSAALLYLLLRGALVDLLGMTVPVPATARLLVVPAAAVWLTAALGLGITRHTARPASLLPLLPIAPVWIYSATFAAYGAFDVRPAVVVAACVAMQLIRAGHAAPTGVGALAMVVAMVMVAVPWLTPMRSGHRIDPRSVVPSVVLPAAAANPIDWVDVWLTRPNTTLFRTETSAPVQYWRLAVLSDYDGERWLAPARYARAGLGVPPARDVTGAVRQTVTVQDLPGPFLPAMDRPVRIGKPVAGVDTDSGTLIAGDPLAAGVRYTVSSLATAAAGPARCAPAVALPVPAELADGLRGLVSEGCVGTFEDFDRGLQKRLNADRHNLAGVPAAGTSVGVLSDFLTGDRRGTMVEFATVYALALRAGGIPSRLVVGFQSTDDQVVAADVRLWAEALLPGRGWTSVHPAFPAAEQDAGVRTVTAPARTPPPASPRGSPSPLLSESPRPDHDRPPAVSGGPVIAVAALAVVAAVPGYLALVILVPVIRRGLRRRRGALRQRGASAWYDVLDELAFTVPVARLRASTPGSTAPLLGDGEDLIRVADISLFAAEPPSADDVRKAWAAATRSRHGLRRRAGWPGRLRRAFSWRNLRLRSPWW
jgi:transglutaminase-like putative cysteine protease